MRLRSLAALLSVWLFSFCLPLAAAAQSLSPLLGTLSKLAQPTPVTMPAPVPVSQAPVSLSNQTLFQVYALSARSAKDRADLASLRLADALRDLPTNGDVHPPSVTVDTGGSNIVIRLDKEPLLTVTQTDATANNESAAEVATTWAGSIRKAFAQTLRERQPAYLHWALKRAAIIVLIAALIHLLIWIVARRWLGKPGWPIQTLIWIWVIRLTLDLFPTTRPINNSLWAGALRPLTVLLIVSLAAAVVARVWSTVLRRLFPPLPEHLSTEERTERTFSRRATLADVGRVTGVAVIWLVATVVGLTWAGVNFSALLTSAGLIGVVISLSAQDPIKDLLAGINILADDRYGVGDTIAIGAYEGTVERLTLRITQIRDIAGRLITIPNRNIAEVANLTARWAQVDLKVGVSYYDDLEHAMEVLSTTANKYTEEHPELALEAPKMLGVDSFNDANITLRLLIRTPPGEQWAVAREMRQRIKVAFDEANLAFLNSQYAVSTPAPKHIASPILEGAAKETEHS